MARVLCIGDTHAPFTHPRYLDHCCRVYDRFHCDRVMHLGDEVDNHAISYHETDPDGFSAGDEGDRAEAQLRAWYTAFPKALVCVGNHGALPYRRAMTAGIPKRFIKSYRDMWGAPKGWNWSETHTIDDVLYTHGTGYSGRSAHINLAIRHRQSTVIGHIHSHAGIQYSACKKDLIFGMNVGCGIDIDAYAMAYGRHFADRPILSCGVVLNGEHAILCHMPMGRQRKTSYLKEI